MIFNERLSQAISGVNKPQPQTVEMNDDSLGGLFAEVVNVRQESFGYMNVMRPRKGILETPTKLNIPPIRSYSFTARTSSGIKDYIAYHSGAALGELSVLNVTDNVFKAVATPMPVGLEPVEFTAIGKFLYVFSPSLAVYMNLDEFEVAGALQARKWLATNSSTPTGGFTFAKKVDDIEEHGIAGFSVGASVIAFPNYNFEEDPTGLIEMFRVESIRGEFFDNEPGLEGPTVNDAQSEPSYRLAAGKYIYEHTLNGEYLVIDGVKYQTPGTTAIYIDIPTLAIVKNTGEGQAALKLYESPSFRHRFNEAVNPFRTTIQRITKVENVYKIFILDEDGREHEVSSNQALYKILPDSGTVDDVLAKGAEYFKSATGKVEKQPDYTEPSVYRGYCLVEVLDDGSVTAPSMIEHVGITMSELQDNNGQAKAIDLSIAAPSLGVVSRYLFATRWVDDVEKIYTPSSERYPNGPFFFHSELDAKAYPVFEDEKTDSQLITPISSDIDIVGGIVSMIIPSGENPGILPSTSTSFKNALLVGGYVMQRPTPVEGLNVVVSTAVGTPTSGHKIKVYFKYSDGQYSSVFEKNLVPGSDYSLKLGRINFQVTGVDVFYERPGVAKPIKFISQADPEFIGMSLKFSTSDAFWNGLEAGTLPVDSGNEAINFRNFICVAENGQTIISNRQYKIFDNSAIQRFYVTGFDAQNNVVRFNMLALTDQNIQAGIIYESGNSFNADFRVVSDTYKVRDIKSAIRRNGTVFCVTSQGLVASNSETAEVILDADQVFTPDGNRFFDSEVNGIAAATENDELYIFNGSGYVCIYDFFSATYRWYKYDLGLSVGAQSAGSLYAIGLTGAGQGIPTVFKLDSGDSVEVVSGWLTTAPLGTPTMSTYIMDSSLHGQGLNVSIDIDSNPGMRQSKVGNWSKEFQATRSTAEQALTMKGVYYTIKSQGVMPRLRINFDGNHSGFLSNLSITTQPLPNKGRSR